MRILWISSLAWSTNGSYPYPVNGAGAVSGSLFQQSLIEALEKTGHEIDVICDYPHHYEKRVCDSFLWEHREGANDIAVRTINIPYVSVLYKSHILARTVKNQIGKKKYDVAVAYLIHQPYLKALSVLKMLVPGIKTILVCPDLPHMMDMSLAKKPIKRFLKQVDMLRIQKLYRYIDGFALFSEKMCEHIPIAGKPYIVIEGIASMQGLDITPVEKEKYILYAGTLHRNIGIEQIIDSLQFIKDEEVKLRIFGTGELHEYIRSKAKGNSRIIYEGFINRDELFCFEKKALALINARNPQDAYTKYSFPSKTFEYLYSGTPFITTKLLGVPQEYSEYLFEIENNSPYSIAQKVNQILDCKQNILDEKCQKGRQFVIEKKNAQFQAEKFNKLLETLRESVM